MCVKSRQGWRDSLGGNITYWRPEVDLWDKWLQKVVSDLHTQRNAGQKLKSHGWSVLKWFGEHVQYGKLRLAGRTPVYLFGLCIAEHTHDKVVHLNEGRDRPTIRATQTVPKEAPQSVATIHLDRVFLSTLFIAWLWIKLPYDFCELYEDLFFHYLDKRSRTWKYLIPTTTNKVSMQQRLAYSSPSPDRPRAILPLPTNCWDSETVPPCSVHTYFSTPPSSFTLRISIMCLN